MNDVARKPGLSTKFPHEKIGFTYKNGEIVAFDDRNAEEFGKIALELGRNYLETTKRRYGIKPE